VAVFYPTMAAATRSNVDVKLKVAGEFEEASKWTSGVSKEAASKMMVSLAKEATKAGKQIANVAIQTMRIPQDVASNLPSVQVKSW
jgi:hypothetical protein